MPAFEMSWCDTLFASWPVDPGLIAPRLPEGLVVDTYDGEAYLSVVPFRIRDIRPAGLPAAVGLSTPELNLRTYVTCEAPAAPGEPAAGRGDARGIYFFSLDADDLLGVVGARLFNHLPYYWADATLDHTGGGVRFESRRRTPGTRAAQFRASYEADGGAEAATTPDPGSLDAFLVERYRYFAEAQDGTIRYAGIDHDPWKLRPATWTVAENTLFRTNGFERPAGGPHLRLGADVSVHATASRRVGDG